MIVPESPVAEPGPMHPFSAALIGWGREHGRHLPWRETADPYAIWLSEVILQQTRVDQGTAYWQRFMRRWPTVMALAQATEDEVLREWQGLGYYSRARHLHAAAKAVAEAGGFPTTFEGLRKLPGVGDYTAAAIASFAYGLPHAAVDGNAYRVLARHFGISTPIDTGEGKKTFAQLAQELLPKGASADFNQAMMDFGATLCTPRQPLCSDCPLAVTCSARSEGRVAQLPVKQGRTAVKTRCMTYVVARSGGRIALHQRAAGDIWQGLWEPPIAENPSRPSEPVALPEWAAGAVLLRQGLKHVLTHRILLADVYLLDCSERPPLPEGYVWVAPEEIGKYALPRLVEKVFSQIIINK